MLDARDELQAQLDQRTRERDLYQRLLALQDQTDLDPFLREALALITSLSGARRGYLALYADPEEIAAPRWWIAEGFSGDELRAVRMEISTGIIAEAVASGRTVLVASALDDARFHTRESVLSFQIKEVLCAPIGSGAAVGVLYLQDRAAPGPFTEAHRQLCEEFARHLAPSAGRLLQARARAEAPDPTRELRRRLKLSGIIGRSQALADVLGQVESAARFQVGVLLRGAPGTGKTALARAIHDNSPRAGRPFVELNCAALPETLLESELFGTRRGAYSGAVDREGLIAAADGGTLFLDEVGELPLGAQAKLLTFLQSRAYTPLGSARERVAEVRVLAATNADLEAAIQARRFREDLYYRLNVMQLRVPGLAERRDDIPLLVRHLCGAFCDKHGLPQMDPAPAALLWAQRAEWPGNVRQLANAVETGVIRAAGGGVLALHHLAPEAARAQAPEAPAPSAPALSFHEATRRFQRDFLEAVLREVDWNVSEAARRLELARSHLHALLSTHNLNRPGDDAPTPPKPPSKKRKF